MREAFIHAWETEVSNYPLLILQAAAMLGILSMALLLHRKNRENFDPGKVFYGFLFGGTNFLLIALVNQFLNIPSKPYLSSDLLFLAGLMGGWLGGGITLSASISARFIFGGVSQVEAVLLDMCLTSLGGVVAHAFYRNKSILNFRWKDVIFLWFLRIVCTLSASAIIFIAKIVPASVSAHVVALQIMGFTTSLLILGSVIALIRFDAHFRDFNLRRIQMYRTDLLTNLPNRRALGEKLAELLKQSDEQHVLITIEVGNIKEMVRTLGHDWTDKFWGYLSEKIAHQQDPYLSNIQRGRSYQLSDLTLALIVERTSLQEVRDRQILIRLHAQITEQLREVGGLYSQVQLRCGVTNLTAGDGANSSAILRNLSLALQSSSLQFRYFDSSVAMQADKDAGVRELLTEWIRTSSPPLQYQPKFNLKSRQVCGAEALLRAVSTDGTNLAPLYILDIAAKYQLLLKLEWCTVEVVVRDISVCLKSGVYMPLSVNLSAESLTVPGFGDKIISSLKNRSVPLELLSIEITESGHVPDIDTVRENIQKLHEAGIGLSLDDFGNGYSGLATLAKIPFTEVKIDYAMVAMIDQPRMNKAVGLAFESASRYGARLVAEGVETEAQSAMLIQMGINYGQGYLFAKAMPVINLVELAKLQKIQVY